VGNIGGNANRATLVVAAGCLAAVCSACLGSTASPTPTPQLISASPTVPGSVPPPSVTIRPSPSPSAETTPTQSGSPSAELPASLAGARAIDVGPYETAGADYSAVSIAPGSGGIRLTYKTQKATGSALIAASAAEVRFLSQTNSQTYPARESAIAWTEKWVVIALEAQQDPGPTGICYHTDVPPIDWRILVAPIDSGGRPGAFSLFASGHSGQIVETPNFEFGEGAGCKAVWGPSIAVSGDIVAYNVESPGADQEFGTRILMRSLADESTVREVATTQYVHSLRLAGSSLFWMEYPGVMTSSLPLKASTEAHPTPQTLLTYKTPENGDTQWSVPAYFAANGSLVWQASTAGKVWSRNIATGKLRQLSPEGSICQLLDFDGTHVLEACSVDTSQTAWDVRFAPDWLVFWSPATSYRLITGVPECWLTAGFVNGAVRVVCQDDGSGGSGAWTIPLGQLT
jgi:hypothetical protein